MGRRGGRLCTRASFFLGQKKGKKIMRLLRRRRQFCLGLGRSTIYDTGSQGSKFQMVQNVGEPTKNYAFVMLLLKRFRNIKDLIHANFLFGKVVFTSWSKREKKLALFSFLYLKKQNFKNICRIGNFSKMDDCRPRLSPIQLATEPKCKKNTFRSWRPGCIKQ